MAPKQLEMSLNTHGGFRKNAGRTRVTKEIPHTARETLTGKHPLHITLKIKKGIPNLRVKKFYQAFKKSVLNAHKKGLKLLQFSILSNHIHIMVEADNNSNLHSAMASLNTSFAKRVNEILGRRGSVFVDRYHLHVLKTAAEVKNAFKYVVLNINKHNVHRTQMDPYSSAAYFKDFDILLGKKGAQLLVPLVWEDFLKAIYTIEEMITEPRTWLARIGWQKAIKRNFYTA